MTVDSRLREMAALLDDVRTLAADIEEQVVCEPLTDLRHYVNWALAAVERAGVALGEGKSA